MVIGYIFSSIDFFFSSWPKNIFPPSEKSSWEEKDMEPVKVFFFFFFPHHECVMSAFLFGVCCLECSRTDVQTMRALKTSLVKPVRAISCAHIGIYSKPATWKYASSHAFTGVCNLAARQNVTTSRFVKKKWRLGVARQLTVDVWTLLEAVKRVPLFFMDWLELKRISLASDKNKNYFVFNEATNDNSMQQTTNNYFLGWKKKRKLKLAVMSCHV